MTTDTVPVEFKKKDTMAHKLIPLIFLVGVFALDQITKFLVVKYIPLYTIKFSFFGDFLRIIHVRNLGAAFSMGSNLATSFRTILLSFLPLIVLIFALVVYFRNNDFTYYQRWLICGVLGGDLEIFLIEYFVQKVLWILSM